MAMHNLDLLTQENAPEPRQRAEQGGEVVVAEDETGQVVDLYFKGYLYKLCFNKIP